MAYIPIIFIALIAFPGHALAATSVVNSVSVTATSGGNTVVNGEIKEGNASGSIQVKTIINGETIEDFSETYTGNTNVTKEFHYATGTGDTTIKTFISESPNEKINSQRKNKEPENRIFPREQSIIQERNSASGTVEIVASSSNAANRPPRIPSRIYLFISEILDNVFSLFSF